MKIESIWPVVLDEEPIGYASLRERMEDELRGAGVDPTGFSHVGFVVTDLRLPGMDGEALIDALRSGWPKLAERTILTSGLLYRPRDPSRYLQKPFTRAQLLKALRAC